MAEELSKIDRDIEQCQSKSNMIKILEEAEDGDIVLLISRKRGGPTNYKWYGRTWVTDRLGLLNYARVRDERDIP